ncbi:ribonuclease H-like domain-containing protein, partial [Tanacetum coccineum]
MALQRRVEDIWREATCEMLNSFETPRARHLIDWRLSEMKEVTAQLKEPVDKGFIRPSSSPLGSSGLVCQEESRIIPEFGDLLEIDLRSGYHQLSGLEEDIRRLPQNALRPLLNFKLPLVLTNPPAYLHVAFDLLRDALSVIFGLSELKEINNGNSWVSVPQTTQENGTSVTKMSLPVTVEEQTNKKNDVKARSLLLMALPNEHQLTFKYLGSIFNRIQKIVSRFAILGVVIAQEDLNLKFLRSLPPEWNTHVVVWMNKADNEIMRIDDLYNNFKIVEQDVKKYVGASSGAQNLAFMTAPSTSSTNDVNTANPAYEVSTVSPNINTTCPQQDLEQIHEDDLEAMNLKWQLSLLSMRAKRYFQRTGKKIFINANDTVGYDKSKVECFNCHKMGHFTRECRAPRNKEGFDWSDMAEEQVQTNMALMAFLDSEPLSHTLEATHVEFFSDEDELEVDLGNIT